MPDPTERLNAALEGRYSIERELGEGGMASQVVVQFEIPRCSWLAASAVNLAERA